MRVELRDLCNRKSLKLRYLEDSDNLRQQSNKPHSDVIKIVQRSQSPPPLLLLSLSLARQCTLSSDAAFCWMRSRLVLVPAHAMSVPDVTLAQGMHRSRTSQGRTLRQYWASLI